MEPDNLRLQVSLAHVEGGEGVRRSVPATQPASSGGPRNAEADGEHDVAGVLDELAKAMIVAALRSSGRHAQMIPAAGAGHAVLHLTPDGYRFVPYAVSEATFGCFLHALALCNWQHGEAARVMGEPLAPRIKEAVHVG